MELTETVEEIQQEQVLLADLISLPLPVLKSSTSLEECILKRRSVRQFKNKDLTLEQISQLLWAGQGITDTKNKLKSAPSAGALYPIDLYVVTSKGVFSYTADGHKIARTLRADLRQGLSNACQGQTFIAEAGITIIITATLSKTTWRYGEKGIRFASLEAGHVAQNILLQAVPLKLNAIPVGQFNDKEVKALLELPTEQLPIYIIPIGYQK
ncbi:MAG: hypothetical protein A2252_06535 [Elusimicrobia bacterium RIFOXYA2_FULL_39_19]|nr:MAG: hypothetical protein A2252_06535 [Elusimicrobia bacterium RIFOXYA2_FULL_39_19]